MFTVCSTFYLEEKLQNKKPHITKIAIYHTQNSKRTLDIFSVSHYKLSNFATFYSMWQCYTCQVKIMINSYGIKPPE